jgi:DUF4097 and DUF4098 domain-containing protein YvlB
MEKTRMTRTFRAESRRSDNLPLWISLGLGLLLMALASTAQSEEAESRTQRFNATLGPGATLTIENISGDIVATRGREFRATVEITVTAPTRQRAREILEKVQVLQSRDGEDFSLSTRWPDNRYRSLFTSRHAYARRCEECKIIARYDVVVPPGVRARLETVNGQVRARDLDGDLKISSVNGNVEAHGVRRSLEAGTVNGTVDAIAVAVSPEASLALSTVNGAVLLTLPKEARFDLAASTMNGSIASTFALPKPEAEPAIEGIRGTRPPRAPRPPRAHRRIVIEREGEDPVVDLKELEEGLEEALRDVEIEIQHSMRDTEKAIREIRVLDPRRAYRGRLGEGGPRVRLTSLNGSITLLAAGTRKEDAKAVLLKRRSFAVTIPQINVRVPKVRVDLPRVRVRVPNVQVDVPERVVQVVPRPGNFDEPEVVRGDVSGDFLSTGHGGSYTIGRVSGKVKILSHSGAIRVASAGEGADLKTFGGNIRLGSVTGDLRAHTAAGDIRAGSVTGSLFAETSGGDILVEDVGGAALAETAGGDIVLAAVSGSVQAETGGGDVRVGIVSRAIKGGIAIRNSGGDVTLTLPSDFKGDVELIVIGSPGFNEDLIRSDFAEVSLTRRPDSQKAVGALNGGGPKVVVRTTSGAIRLRKGPTAER